MKIIIDDAAIARVLDKRSVLAIRRQISEIREFFEIPETEPEPKYDDTAERDYIAYCDGLSGGSEKYTTVRQCAARMMGIAARRQKTLTILTIDELAGKLDALLTREEKQSK